MYQSNFKLAILVAFLIGLVAQVSAHGIMLSPPCRIVDMDTQQETIKTVSDPTTKHPCGAAGDGHGPTTMYMPGEMMIFAYNVSISHPGNCYVQYNKHGDDEEGFHELMDLGECGKKVGLFTALVKMPEEHAEMATVRFAWDDDLGNSYLNCANVKISDKHSCEPCMRKRTRSLRF